MVLEFIEKIEDETKTSFTVSSILVKTLREFQRFCKEKCGNSYSIGISILLDTKEKYETLIPMISNLQSQIDELRLKLIDKLNSRGGKTFG